MKIEFDTSPYEFSHGKAPRGRGMWAFSTSSRPDHSEVYYTGQCSLTDAKKDAADHYRRSSPGRNFLTLYVLA